MNEKLLGTLLLTATGFLFAWLRLREGLRQASLSEAMEEALRRMRTQTVLCLEPLPEMLEREAAGATPSAPFFQAVLERYRIGLGFQAAWENSVQQTDALFAALIPLLLPLGSILGTCAAEIQGEALERTTEALKILTEAMRTTVRRRGMLETRLFPCLCLTAALLLWQ